MANQERRLRLPGDIQRVRAACDFVVSAAREAGMDEDGVFQCQLSIEEVFTNIVEHGYKHQGDNKSIEIITEVSDDVLRIRIADEAPQFDPLALDEPDPGASLEQRGEGGWGVFFVRKYMDAIRYHFSGSRNWLTLEKKITK